jgi:signal transduction histidine kinase/ActR/RegA family two-component response regulator
LSLAAFAHQLSTSREELIHRWLDAVRRAPVPSARDLPEPQLRDHLPDLLDEIIRAVAGKSTPAVEDGGREHGQQRWGSGYDIDEVIHELSVLRQLLLDTIEGYACGPEGLSPSELMEAVRRLDEVLDRSSQAGVAQYHAEAISIRRQLWDELEAANIQLKAAHEQKDRFLAMLSHELRNPLAPILTAVQLLEFSEGSDPRLRRARDVIERQVRHQARLIDDLLDVSRIVQGKMMLRREAHNLKAALASAVEECLPGIEAKGQELRVEMSDEPLPVDADPIRLAQIVTNLLTNANRYTDPGGTIWLTVGSADGEVILRIRDTGIGIDPELLPRVFDLFTQADSSKRRTQAGLGIGLALVRSLAELHGGTVEARSAGPGQGSEFELRLPVVTAAAAPALHIQAPLPSPTGQRIALVEDNPDARRMMAELLELLGYEVLTAADGPAALRMAEEAPPSVFVVDIGLPGMDGYEVARRLREMPECREAFLVALSGYGGLEDQEQARAAGFDVHLTKPADIDALEQLLSERADRRAPTPGRD